MTRRLTVGSRSEMGLPYQPEPDTPITSPWPSTTSYKNEWKVPSRWQTSPPRFRQILKIIGLLVLTRLILKIYYDKEIPEMKKQKGEKELKEEKDPSKPDGNWAWKDYPQHMRLTRGTQDLLQPCPASYPDCEMTIPDPVRYTGLKNFRDPVDDIVSCIGPRGLPLNESDEDAIWAYNHLPNDSVEPLLGSYESSGLDGEVVFDRNGRFAAYGLDEFDTWSMEDQDESSEFSWDDVAWGDLQDACVEINAQRFKHVDERPDSSIQYSNIKHSHPNGHSKTGAVTKSATDSTAKVKRTAILIRVWTGVDWTADAVMNIRALIAEASLASGGKYQVFILLHVKDEQVPLFVGEDEPDKTIAKNVPPEFRSITEVWNHAQIRGLYSNIAEHAFVGRSPWMIVQWFARNHPEFDFFYQWEYDVRYTGHYLDFFEAVSEFGKQQPRKGMWERAGRHYIPSLHGAYDSEYRDYVRNVDPHRIWGPVAVEGVKPRGPKPSTREDKDEYTWGVGEEADWVGFLPSFNVTSTKWFFKDNIWGYDQKLSTPRRATLVAQGRVSRRVLDIMNYENAENGHHMDAEMFPQSMALHHGLKSTTFPHPIFSDRHWPAQGANKIFNPGPFEQAGGTEDSVFSKWNEWVWTNMTWYYNAGQAKPIFQHLLGTSALDIGGSEWETEHGRAVIRPMLLHPVKGAKAMKWTPTGWIATKSGK